MEIKNYPLIVVGAGAGGLVVAIGYAKAGKKVLMIEKGTYGGDCTNFGCIPSKSLIASAEIAHAIKHAKEMGIEISNNSFIADNALKRVQTIVAEIQKHEDQSALKKSGIDTLTGTAEFVDKNVLKVALTEAQKEVYVKGKKIVIATGSTPNIPPIDGIKETPYLTNETVFSIKKIPSSMIVIGGGPIGCELAQAFARLGSKVSIVQKNPQLLNREENNASELISSAFEKEGIDLYTDFQAEQICYLNNNFEIKITNSFDHKKLQAKALLVASGRKVNLNSLHLEKAGIETSTKGILVDKYCRTSQKHIYAVGDVLGPPFFTHLAENRARVVLSNLLLPWPFKKRINPSTPIPRVTYTSPEIASFGLTKKEALKKYSEKKIAVYHFPYNKIDRAICQGKTDGFIQIVTKKWSSKIIGATIVGKRAGELLCELLLAVNKNIKLRKISYLIHPYPTFSLGLRQTADLWLKETIIPLIFRKK